MTGWTGKLSVFYLPGSHNNVEVNKGEEAINKYKRDYTLRSHGLFSSEP
jgi:hypothetical protein